METSVHNKNDSPLVTVYTQVYNTKPFLVQCIESVLSQTFTDFEYILVDNGCTDGCGEILDRYAEEDRRIKLIRYEKNRLGIWKQMIAEHATGYYLSILDSDDWWEPDYLERLIGFLEKNELDLAITGTVQYFQENHSNQIFRKVDQPLVLTRVQFAQLYLWTWEFPSTTWGSVMKVKLFKQTDADGIIAKKYPYGGDTMFMLQYMKQCARIGIDNSALYHYRIHPKSVTFQYNPRRFDAAIAYYEQIRAFLEFHQTFDTQKQEWLKRVHLRSMSKTLTLLRDAHISLEQKQNECLRILKHPLTGYVLTGKGEEREQWFTLMWEILFMGLSDSSCICREKLTEALCILSPDCGKAFRPEDIELLSREPALWEAVKANDQKRLAGLLLELIAGKRFSKQYDLGAILHRLIPKGSVLREMEDTRFFRTYAQDCAEIIAGNQLAALDHMTELLLEGKKLYASEQFLNIYLSLAAIENCAEAFVLGKLQLAKLYLRESRCENCRIAAQELVEMGLENEELSALCRELQELEKLGDLEEQGAQP